MLRANWQTSLKNMFAEWAEIWAAHGQDNKKALCRVGCPLRSLRSLRSLRGASCPFCYLSPYRIAIMVCYVYNLVS